MKDTIMGAAIALALLFGTSAAMGHPGDTDANGCHTNHQTGEYHCHKPKP